MTVGVVNVVRRGETTSADRRGGSVDGHLVLRGIGQFAGRIGGEDQDRGAGPAIRAGDRRTNRHEGRGDRIRNAAQRHHRFREDDPDFVRLAEILNFIGRPALNNRQCGRLLR